MTIHNTSRLALLVLFCTSCLIDNTQTTDPVVAQFKNNLSTSNSLYVSVSARNGPGAAAPLHRNTSNEYILRATSSGLVALDQVNGLHRITFDGTGLTIAKDDTVENPDPVYDTIGLAAWNEVRTGLPNTTFLPESPRVRESEFLEGGLDWYRLDYPLLGTTERTAYVGFSPTTHEPEGFVVYKGTSDQKIQLWGNYLSEFHINAIDWNAPVDEANLTAPEARQPGLPLHLATGGVGGSAATPELITPPVRAKRLSFDYLGRRSMDATWIAGTWAGVIPILDQLEFDNSHRSFLRYSDMTCTGEAGVWLAPFEFQWRTAPNDPRLANLAQTLQCPTAGLGIALQSTHSVVDKGVKLNLKVHIEAGQVSQGSYEVIASHDWEDRVYGRGHFGGVRTIPGSELSYTGGDLMIKVQGAYSMECVEGVAGTSSVSFHPKMQPVLDFTSCPNL